MLIKPWIEEIFGWLVLCQVALAFLEKNIPSALEKDTEKQLNQNKMT